MNGCSVSKGHNIEMLPHALMTEGQMVTNSHVCYHIQFVPYSICAAAEEKNANIYHFGYQLWVLTFKCN